jgi:hypothetical protein
MLEAVRSLDRDYGVVTKQMIMTEARIKNEMHFDSMMALLKKEGEVYSPKHGQYVPATTRRR